MAVGISKTPTIIRRSSYGSLENIMLFPLTTLYAPETEEIGRLIGFEGDTTVRQWADNQTRIAIVETNEGESLYLREEVDGITVRRTGIDGKNEYIEPCPGGFFVNGNPLIVPIAECLVTLSRDKLPKIDMKSNPVQAATIKVAALKTASSIFRTIDLCVAGKVGPKNWRDAENRLKPREDGSSKKGKLLKAIAGVLGKKSEAKRPSHAIYFAFLHKNAL
jgi:hypothetical protein